MSLPTHCKYGHEYTAGNTAFTPQGVRRCRACQRAKSARNRERARGGPLPLRRTQAEILLGGVEEDPQTGCWMWKRHLNPVSGYGYAYQQGHRGVLAHRLSFETFVGPIPEGLEIDHLCRVRACINPRHLEPVTRSENVRRARAAKPQTHCRRGHLFDEENTYRKRNGGRTCKACGRLRVSARQQDSCRAEIDGAA